MRIYKLTDTLNTRDLGGYKTIDGNTTKYYRFIRSDALRFINELDYKFFLDHNIKNQLDFRTKEIKDLYPSKLENNPLFNYYLCPLKEGSYRSLKEEDNIPSLYMRMISRHEIFYDIFKTIIKCDGGIIISCTAGKDRTGIVTYLLLSLVGVNEEDIVLDFCESEVLIYKNIDSVLLNHPEFPKILGYSKKEYIVEFIKLFKEKYIDAYHYLKHIGLNEEDINIIKDKLLK